MAQRLSHCAEQHHDESDEVDDDQGDEHTISELHCGTTQSNHVAAQQLSSAGLGAGRRALGIQLVVMVGLVAVVHRLSFGLLVCHVLLQSRCAACQLNHAVAQPHSTMTQQGTQHDPAHHNPRQQVGDGNGHN